MNICPICSNDEEKKFLCKTNLVYQSEFDLIECSECGAIYFDPMPTDDQLSRFYSGSYFNFSKWHDEAKGKVYANWLTKIKEEGNFLDIGCALGFFINEIRNNSKWKVYGVELGTDAVKFATQQLGLDVKQSLLRNAGYKENFFDYIHINNVLEHVREPKLLLSECRRIIKDDGYLFLSVPNGFNDSRSLIDFYNSEKLPARSVNGHIFFFQHQTFCKLFKDTGFKIESKKTGNLKRGFRNYGLIPRKKNWKNEFFPHTSPEEIQKTEIVIEKKKHSDFYYRYRYLQSHLHDIPGLHNFGLDFIFLLRPVIK